MTDRPYYDRLIDWEREIQQAVARINALYATAQARAKLAAWVHWQRLRQGSE